MPDSRSSTASRFDASELFECHLYMRLAREWELRFEKLFRTGGVSKWYSAVGNEAVTVPAASLLEKGDALFSLHRDSGAILRYYTKRSEIFSASDGTATGISRQRIFRLACQMLGKDAGFSRGFDRSYHYNYVDEEAGIYHFGMISHLGSMLPVAAGAAWTFRRKGSDRVALNFIGDGGTSTGDFHEGLNMAAVLEAPLVVIVQNNEFAFSTAACQQYAAESLASRGVGYGIAAERVDGHDAAAMLCAVRRAIERARGGGGPTLIEAMLMRVRGHSEGDNSLTLIPDERLRAAKERDPLALLERRLIEEGVTSEVELRGVEKYCASLMLEIVDAAVQAAEPSVSASERPTYCE